MGGTAASEDEKCHDDDDKRKWKRNGRRFSGVINFLIVRPAPVCAIFIPSYLFPRFSLSYYLIYYTFFFSFFFWFVADGFWFSPILSWMFVAICRILFWFSSIKRKRNTSHIITSETRLYITLWRDKGKLWRGKKTTKSAVYYLNSSWFFVVVLVGEKKHDACDSLSINDDDVRKPREFMWNS